MKNIQADGYTQKDFFAKTIDFFFPPLNMWDKGVGVLFFGLYKELCVCVRAEMREYVIVIFSRYGCLVITSQSMPKRALQDYF